MVCDFALYSRQVAKGVKLEVLDRFSVWQKSVRSSSLTLVTAILRRTPPMSLSALDRQPTNFERQSTIDRNTDTLVVHFVGLRNMVLINEITSWAILVTFTV